MRKVRTSPGTAKVAAKTKKRTRFPDVREEFLHIAVASLLDQILPNDAVWTTVPIGGGGRIRAIKLKKMGVTAGWPDIQILWDGKLFLIELKRVNEYLNEAQRVLHPKIISSGGCVVTLKPPSGPNQINNLLENVKVTLRLWGIIHE